MQAVSTEIFKDAQPDVLQNRSSLSPTQQEQKKKRCNTVSTERFAMASTAERKTRSQGCPQPALRASVKAGPRAASSWAAKVCTGACERKPSARAPPAKEQNKTSTERMTHEQSTAVCARRPDKHRAIQTTLCGRTTGALLAAAQAAAAMAAEAAGPRTSKGHRAPAWQAQHERV
jgi:hypothetical protein